MSWPATSSVGADAEGELVAERDLVASAKRGDGDALAVLIRTHADRLHATLRRFGLDEGEAEETAQEVFVRAWRSLDRFEGRARFSTWLYRIGFNEAQRRLGRRRPDEGTGGTAAEASALLEDPAPGPQARALDRELAGVLERALASLPLEQRVAVTLRDVEGLSTQEAADVVGLAETAFKSRLHRGRMALRAELAPRLERRGS